MNTKPNKNIEDRLEQIEIQSEIRKERQNLPAYLAVVFAGWYLGDVVNGGETYQNAELVKEVVKGVGIGTILSYFAAPFYKAAEYAKRKK